MNKIHRIVILLLMLMGVASAAQSPLSYVPTKMAAFVSPDGTGSDGSWAALTGTGGLNALTFVPTRIGIYYSSDGTGNIGTWVPWNGAGGGGGGGTPGGAPGSLQYNLSGSFGGLAATAPNQVAISSGAGVFGVRQLTQDDILPGFSITSFSGGSNVEIGSSVTNPAFTASYSATPTSAQITNTDGIGSPTVLTTPFTSGTVTGTFTKTSAASTTFTLSATASTTKTATQAINWLPRTFGGVGATGATSSVTATGTTAVLSTGDVLASAGLNNQTNYGPYSPSVQKIYILMVGGSHTFKDPNTGFSFAFNAPTAVSFVNANGTTVAMFLYESTNTLSGTFTVQVAS